MYRSGSGSCSLCCAIKGRAFLWQWNERELRKWFPQHLLLSQLFFLNWKYDETALAKAFAPLQPWRATLPTVTEQIWWLKWESSPSDYIPWYLLSKGKPLCGGHNSATKSADRIQSKEASICWRWCGMQYGLVSATADFDPAPVGPILDNS